MSTVPNKILDKIQYFRGKAPGWVTNAVAIGTSVAEATDVETKAEAAFTAYQEQQDARSTAEAKTVVLHNAVRAMSIAGAGVIKQVGVKAETTGNPDIYALAQLPVPATPSPVAPPGKPFDFGVALLPNGTIELSWRCENPANAAGPLYHIYRREMPGTPWNFIAGTGEKKFIDTTVPAGVPHVYYQVQAARANSVGIAAEFTVNFGTTPSGMVTATVTQAPKLAA